MFNKILLVAVAVVLTVGYAQAQSQVRFGVQTGLHLSSFGGSDADALEDALGDAGIPISAKKRPGFRLGIVAERPINENFDVQAGLFFAPYGVKYHGSETYAGVKITEDISFNLNYLQLQPASFIYKYDLGSVKLMAQAGVHLNFGVGGKVKIKAKGGGVSESHEMKVKYSEEGDDPDVMYCSFMDIGLGIGAGVEFLENFQAGVGYNLGVLSIAQDDDVRVTNRCVMFTLTYLFGKYHIK